MLLFLSFFFNFFICVFSLSIHLSERGQGPAMDRGDQSSEGGATAATCRTIFFFFFFDEISAGSRKSLFTLNRMHIHFLVGCIELVPILDRFGLAVCDDETWHTHKSYETILLCYPAITPRQQLPRREESVCLARVFWFVYSLESHSSPGLPSPERPDINGPTVWPTNLTEGGKKSNKQKERERESCCWPVEEKNKNQNNSSRRN